MGLGEHFRGVLFPGRIPGLWVICSDFFRIPIRQKPYFSPVRYVSHSMSSSGLGCADICRILGRGTYEKTLDDLNKIRSTRCDKVD